MPNTAHPIEENAEALVDHMLRLLRSKMQEKCMSQLSVQEALGWGRTYISQLFRKQKALRVDQVLMILDTLGVEPQEFFAEMFGTPQVPQFGAPTARDRERLVQVMTQTHQKSLRHHANTPREGLVPGGTCQSEDCPGGVCHGEFSATVRALVYFAATIGKAPMDHFVGIYRREMQREGLLGEGEE